MIPDTPATCEQGSGGPEEPLFDQAPSRFVLDVGEDYVSFDGVVRSGPAPALHRESRRSGSCRLLTYTPSFCDPACSDNGVCVDGACVAAPPLESLGTLQLSGVAADIITLQPNAVMHYVWTSMDKPAPITKVSLAGRSERSGPFELSVCAGGPVKPRTNWSTLFSQRKPGSSVNLQWSNPDATARVYLRMTTGIGTHGGISPLEIECDGRDVGSLELAGEFLDALYAGGWSCGECGNNLLQRYHAAQAVLDDRAIELRTQSAAVFFYRP